MLTAPMLSKRSTTSTLRDMNESKREFDVVVYGASGFTGRLVADYLAQRYGTDADLSWAVAGRNPDKLKRVLAEIGLTNDAVPVLQADSGDAETLRTMAARTQVVLTTVGPYAQYGDALVAACVAEGTGYCDLAGEAQWMRKMIDAHHDDALTSGARIVHACGFDSIPSDMGVYHLQQASNARHGQPCSEVRMLVRAMKGGFSGGTAASLLNAVKEGRRNRSIARILRDPYALNPETHRGGPDRRDQSGAVYDEDAKVWTAPFVMALINTRVVRRSNALFDNAYGSDFRYSEATSTGPGALGRVKAMTVAGALGGFMLASAFDFSREQILSRLLPDAGEGPDAEEREQGYFNLMLYGRTPDGQKLRVRVTGDRDPGYGSTSKMIAESAVCLAKDELSVGGGFWTPATAFGETLIDRLTRNAGLTFEVVEPT